MLLIIDNYDSFTFNLVQYFGELALKKNISNDILVKRNDAISISEINHLKPKSIVLSPGPGDPDQSGICLDILKEFASDIPILGVCLGHQAIAQSFGGKIVPADELMHGKTSKVFHSGEGLFNGSSTPLIATRYHSLIVERASLPDCFEITAWTNNINGDIDEIMGIKHKSYPISGVQFHPESILTSYGHELLKNFLKNNN